MVESQVPGGFSGFQPLDQESEEFVIFLSLQDQMEEKASTKFEQFEVIDFQKQVVAGMNYKMRIRVASGETGIAHVCVYQPLPHTGMPAEVKSIAVGKGMESEFDTGAQAAGADVEMSQPNEEGAQAEGAEQEKPQGQSISSMVNQSEVQMLMDMGYSKVVAEKSLFLVQGGGVPKAMEWIEKNCEQPDFEEELVIVGQDDKPKSNLTPEEKAAKALELQRAARARMAAQEEAQHKETEAARIRMDKEMAAVKKMEDERRYKLDIEEKMREKKLAEERLEKQRRQYELDMQERFGKDWKAKAEAAKEEKKPEMSPSQMVEHGIKTVTTIYTEARQPGVATTCLKTCQTLINNLIKDPQNEKFQKVNLENKAISERVAKINGGVMILKGAGFVPSQENPNMLVIGKIDMKVLAEASQILKFKLD